MLYGHQVTATLYTILTLPALANKKTPGFEFAGTPLVAFTPVQVLEINTSHMPKKVVEAKAKYFGTNTFRTVK